MPVSVVTPRRTARVSRSFAVLACVLSLSSSAHAQADAAQGAHAPAPAPVSTGVSPDATDDDSAATGFACDGTDPFLLAEINEALKTRIGYGETWDESVCDNGTAIYGEGATSRWPAFRVKRAWEPTKDEQFLALAMPIVAFGGLGFAVVVAALIAAVMRLKKQVVVDVECPACTTSMPWTVGEGGGQLFCPSCGAPFRVDVTGRGRDAQVAAVPL